jgi:cysteine desulfurase family protein
MYRKLICRRKGSYGKMIYFDNAATSWPKPPQVGKAMQKYLKETGASPGRSGHRLSVQAARLVYDTREKLTRLFNASDPLGIVFTKNATEAINIAVFGLLKRGDHVITSSMEHNSVTRPLTAMKDKGVSVTVVACDREGVIEPALVAAAIRKNTKAIFLTHASNVTGAVMPVYDIGVIARKHSLIFCVDAAQTAGCLPIDVRGMNIDLMAFTGHKSLFGPPGTGGLYIREGLEKKIAPLLAGGTGSSSEMEKQPEFMPDRYEAGTPNTVGIAGLQAGVDFVLGEGVKRIEARESELTEMFIESISDLPGITVYTQKRSRPRLPVVSFNLTDMDPARAAMLLDERYGIMCRSGLHCAPAAHKTIGTYPAGTLRFSFSCLNTQKEVEKAVAAIRKISGRKK